MITSAFNVKFLSEDDVVAIMYFSSHKHFTYVMSNLKETMVSLGADNVVIDYFSEDDAE